MSKRQPVERIEESAAQVARSATATAVLAPAFADQQAANAPATGTRSLVLQAKLQVGAAHDPLEAEADAMAAAFVGWSPQPAGTGAAEATAERTVARRVRRAPAATAVAADPMGSFAAPADVEQRIDSARGKGSALPDPLRARFESFFAADLSGVRVHQGGESADLNRSLSARAFTTGADVFLGAGEKVSDERLMAHELTHVVQQAGGSASASRMVQREGLTATDVREGTGTAADKTSTAMDNANGIHEAATGDQVGSAGYGESGEILGLFSALTELWGAVSKLFEAKKNRVGEETIAEAVGAVAAAGNAVKGAISVAQAFGASVAMAVVPGLDLALASLSLCMHAAKQFTLYQGLWAGQKVLDDSAAKPDMKAAVGTVHARTWKAIGLNWATIVGDALLIAGSALNLTGVGAIAGTVLKAVGAAAQLGAAIGNLFIEHAEAKAVQAARAAYGEAEASGDTAKMADAKSERLKVDATFAVEQLLAALGTENDPSAAAVLATFGIGPKWLERYLASPVDKRDAQRDEAADIVLSYLGVERDPQTLGDKIVGGLKKIKDSITGLFSRKKKP